MSDCEGIFSGVIFEFDDSVDEVEQRRLEDILVKNGARAGVPHMDRLLSHLISKTASISPDSMALLSDESDPFIVVPDWVERCVQNHKILTCVYNIEPGHGNIY